MTLLKTAIKHILKVAEVPSFSTYEERLHPYIESVMDASNSLKKHEVPGNNLIYDTQSTDSETIALASHLDKINHYGVHYPEKLPAFETDEYLEGAMDNSVGVGIMLAIASRFQELSNRPRLLFFFSEMEESKGLKEHPELLKNRGKGFQNGMGAEQISKTCINKGLIPDEVITIDTTPLFKGDPGVALYSKHWEYNKLDASKELQARTAEIEQHFRSIDGSIRLANNTNDYLHYGYEFNISGEHTVASIALEPAIYPYHQKGERVFIEDIDRVLKILSTHIGLPTF